MRYKIKGVLRRNKSDRVKRNMDMMKFMSGEDVKQRKVRRERSDSGGSHNNPEEELRNEIIKELRASGFKVKRIENSITGKNNVGLPDLFVTSISTNFMGFIEVKTPGNWKANKLKGEQLAFRKDCLRCGVKHWVIRSLDDLNPVRIGETVFEPEVD